MKYPDHWYLLHCFQSSFFGSFFPPLDFLDDLVADFALAIFAGAGAATVLPRSAAYCVWGSCATCQLSSNTQFRLSQATTAFGQAGIIHRRRCVSTMLLVSTHFYALPALAGVWALPALEPINGGDDGLRG
jgi:hypothetical protein